MVDKEFKQFKEDMKALNKIFDTDVNTATDKEWQLFFDANDKALESSKKFNKAMAARSTQKHKIDK